ncbi:MAG TPA: Hsp20/alpha crystallin family protein [Candidatus Melainabacteria bacterium]|nr:Hsp20/alpha crystallin family protein [Candidatus Melainabacteria bacterium]
MLLPRLIGNDFFGSLKDMQRVQEQLNRLFYEEGKSAEFPPVNVWTSPDGAIVRTEIPGIDPEKIDITIVNETLTIRGSRLEESTKDCHSCHRKERGFGQFVRSLQLPFLVDSDKVKASFKDGVLEIELPRAEADKPRRISVVSE